MTNRFQKDEMIGDYRVDGFIGAGGMGEVYKGVHSRLNRAAAIKVLNVTSLNEPLVSRFHNEARVQSTLQHQNIATLYDFQQVDGHLCIFMEYVDGESLEDLIEKRFFSIDEALQVFHSVLEAVSFTHSNGIIHRDIKSQNIKLTASGSPKLLDFGIAKDSASNNLTKEGGVIGTPNYIAPEQLLGAKASASTDVWALGVLLYEMLTGLKPFEADTIGELCEQIKASRFEPVENLNSAVPKSVLQIVGKCLSKDPRRRYQNASEVSREVVGVLKTEYGVRSGSDGSPGEGYQNEQRDPPGKRRALAITLAASGVFVFFGFLGFGVWTIAPSPKKAAKTNSSPLAAPRSGQSDPESDSPQILPQKNRVPTASNPDTAKTNGQTFGNGLSQVTIDVIGSAAEVIRNGEILGKTPFELRAPDRSVVNLVLRRQGYADKNIQVEVISDKGVYTFVLKPR